MTKIWLLSDLHQEFVRDSSYGAHPATAFDPSAAAPDEFDVVVVAGDVDVPLTRSLEWVASRFAGVRSIYVPGNHDFYNGESDPSYTMSEQIDAGRELADRLGVDLLLDSAVEIDGTRFLGGTLWTDFGSVGYGSLGQKIREASGRYGMNDYKRIKRWSSKHEGKRKRLRPQDTIAAHQSTRGFLEQTLSVPFDGPTVVVTHHAPHPESLGTDRRSLDFCYASHLRLMLEDDSAPDLWLHGHVHRPVDYMVGNTRIVSNPRGYAFTPEEAAIGFDPRKVVEVPAPAPAPCM